MNTAMPTSRSSSSSSSSINMQDEEGHRLQGMPLLDSDRRASFGKSLSCANKDDFTDILLTDSNDDHDDDHDNVEPFVDEEEGVTKEQGATHKHKNKNCWQRQRPSVRIGLLVVVAFLVVMTCAVVGDLIRSKNQFEGHVERATNDMDLQRLEVDVTNPLPVAWMDLAVPFQVLQDAMPRLSRLSLPDRVECYVYGARTTVVVDVATSLNDNQDDVEMLGIALKATLPQQEQVRGFADWTWQALVAHPETTWLIMTCRTTVRVDIAYMIPHHHEYTKTIRTQLLGGDSQGGNEVTLVDTENKNKDKDQHDVNDNDNYNTGYGNNHTIVNDGNGNGKSNATNAKDGQVPNWYPSSGNTTSAAPTSASSNESNIVSDGDADTAAHIGADYSSPDGNTNKLNGMDNNHKPWIIQSMDPDHLVVGIRVQLPDFLLNAISTIRVRIPALVVKARSVYPDDNKEDLIVSLEPMDLMFAYPFQQQQVPYATVEVSCQNSTATTTSTATCPWYNPAIDLLTVKAQTTYVRFTVDANGSFLEQFIGNYHAVALQWFGIPSPSRQHHRDLRRNRLTRHHDHNEDYHSPTSNSMKTGSSDKEESSSRIPAPHHKNDNYNQRSLVLFDEVVLFEDLNTTKGMQCLHLNDLFGGLDFVFSLCLDLELAEGITFMGYAKLYDFSVRANAMAAWEIVDNWDAIWMETHADFTINENDQLIFFDAAMDMDLQNKTIEISGNNTASFWPFNVSVGGNVALQDSVFTMNLNNASFVTTVNNELLESYLDATGTMTLDLANQKLQGFIQDPSLQFEVDSWIDEGWHGTWELLFEGEDITSGDVDASVYMTGPSKAIIVQMDNRGMLPMTFKSEADFSDDIWSIYVNEASAIFDNEQLVQTSASWVLDRAAQTMSIAFTEPNLNNLDFQFEGSFFDNQELIGSATMQVNDGILFSADLNVKTDFSDAGGIALTLTDDIVGFSLSWDQNWTITEDYANFGLEQLRLVVVDMVYDETYDFFDTRGHLNLDFNWDGGIYTALLKDDLLDFSVSALGNWTTTESSFDASLSFLRLESGESNILDSYGELVAINYDEQSFATDLKDKNLDYSISGRGEWTDSDDNAIQNIQIMISYLRLLVAGESLLDMSGTIDISATDGGSYSGSVEMETGYNSNLELGSVMKFAWEESREMYDFNIEELKLGYVGSTFVDVDGDFFLDLAKYSASLNLRDDYASDDSGFAVSLFGAFNDTLISGNLGGLTIVNDGQADLDLTLGFEIHRGDDSWLRYLFQENVWGTTVGMKKGAIIVARDVFGSFDTLEMSAEGMNVTLAGDSWVLGGMSFIIDAGEQTATMSVDNNTTKLVIDMDMTIDLGTDFESVTDQQDELGVTTDSFALNSTAIEDLIINVNAIFEIFNAAGLTAEMLLLPENLDLLEQMFESFVATIMEDQQQRLLCSLSSCHQRKLSVSLQSGSTGIYNITDVQCKSANTAVPIPENATCQNVYGTYGLVVVDEDAETVANKYEQATEASISDGKLQEILKEKAQNSTVLAAIVVAGPVEVTADVQSPPQSPQDQGNDQELEPDRGQITVKPGPTPQTEAPPTSDDEGMAWWTIFLICIFSIFGVWLIGFGAFHLFLHKNSGGDTTSKETDPYLLEKDDKADGADSGTDEQEDEAVPLAAPEAAPKDPLQSSNDNGKNDDSWDAEMPDSDDEDAWQD